MARARRRFASSQPGGARAATPLSLEPPPPLVVIAGEKRKPKSEYEWEFSQELCQITLACVVGKNNKGGSLLGVTGFAAE